MRGGATGSMFCACPDFPRVFFLTIVVQNVVQVPWLPDVTEGHLTLKGFPWVCACATGSWDVSLFFRVFSDMLCSTLRPRFFLGGGFGFFQNKAKMKCYFYSVTEVTLHFKGWISNVGVCERSCSISRELSIYMEHMEARQVE